MSSVEYVFSEGCAPTTLHGASTTGARTEPETVAFHDLAISEIRDGNEAIATRGVSTTSFVRLDIGSRIESVLEGGDRRWTWKDMTRLGMAKKHVILSDQVMLINGGAQTHFSAGSQLQLSSAFDMKNKAWIFTIQCGGAILEFGAEAFPPYGLPIAAEDCEFVPQVSVKDSDEDQDSRPDVSAPDGAYTTHVDPRTTTVHLEDSARDVPKRTPNDVDRIFLHVWSLLWYFQNQVIGAWQFSEDGKKSLAHEWKRMQTMQDGLNEISRLLNADGMQGDTEKLSEMYEALLRIDTELFSLASTIEEHTHQKTAHRCTLAEVVQSGDDVPLHLQIASTVRISHDGTMFSLSPGTPICLSSSVIDGQRYFRLMTDGDIVHVFPAQAFPQLGIIVSQDELHSDGDDFGGGEITRV